MTDDLSSLFGSTPAPVQPVETLPTKKQSLYDLTAEFYALMEADTDDDISSALTELSGQIEAKAEHYCHFLNTIDSDIDRYRAEEKRIATARKAMESKVERVREYMKEALLAANIMSVSAGTFKISVVKTAGKLVIEDSAVIPAQFLTYVPASTVPNNAEIKEAIKDGESVPGAKIEAGFSLRIK
jgi:hypothetical protein